MKQRRWRDFGPPAPKNLEHPAFRFRVYQPSGEWHGAGPILRFDGSCEGNGSASATGKWAFTLHGGDGALIDSGSGPTIVDAADRVTNNVSEWQGLRAGLRRASAMGLPGLLIQGDSQLVVLTLNGVWGSKQPLLTVYRDECRDLLAAMNAPWAAEWIPREQNEVCDAMTRPDAV
jgi:ribonuclease HI